DGTICFQTDATGDPRIDAEKIAPPPEIDLDEPHSESENRLVHDARRRSNARSHSAPRTTLRSRRLARGLPSIRCPRDRRPPVRKIQPMTLRPAGEAVCQSASVPVR